MVLIDKNVTFGKKIKKKECDFWNQDVFFVNGYKITKYFSLKPDPGKLALLWSQAILHICPGAYEKVTEDLLKSMIPKVSNLFILQ